MNVFLNFYPASFSLHDINFHSSEQYIQYQKSKLFRDHKTCKKILESEDALEAKKLVKEIAGFDFRKWKESARELCEPGVLAKFLQNPSIMDKLLSTGTKNIVECSHDTLWGCGKPLQNQSFLISDSWSGENLLRQILMSVHDFRNSINVDNNTNEEMDTGTANGDN